VTGLDAYPLTDTSGWPLLRSRGGGGSHHITYVHVLPLHRTHAPRARIRSACAFRPHWLHSNALAIPHSSPQAVFDATTEGQRRVDDGQILVRCKQKEQKKEGGRGRGKYNMHRRAVRYASEEARACIHSIDYYLARHKPSDPPAHHLSLLSVQNWGALLGRGGARDGYC